MSKNTKKQQNEQEIQAKSEELLAKIEEQRAAGELVVGDGSTDEIRAAKEKLNEAYKKLAAMEKQSQALAKKKDPATHTYSEEDKKRILENARKATERYTKLRDFVEKYERMDKERKLDEMMKQMIEQEKAANAEEAKKDEE